MNYEISNSVPGTPGFCQKVFDALWVKGYKPSGNVVNPLDRIDFDKLPEKKEID
jgi:hypothetical protein